MSNNDNIKKLIGIAALAGAGVIIGKEIVKNKKSRLSGGKTSEQSLVYTDKENRQVYFIGGGLGSLAGAAYLIRDCNFKGENIHIFEGLKTLGGSNDACGNAEDGYLCRGGRMLNEETYENFWELFSSIPSLEHPGKSVTDEILNFDRLHPTYAQARLIDGDGKIIDIKSMGFNNSDRMAMAKLLATPEKALDDVTIEEWFVSTPHIFETNFWHMWQTTFAFQKWSSVFELRRYMNRMIVEFSRIETLEGVTRTPYNQYESVILPITKFLEGYNVDFITDTVVTDIDFKEGNRITAIAIHVNKDEKEEVIELNEGDVCIMTNGCMTDKAAVGSLDTAPEFNCDKPMSGELWAKICNKKPNLGNPEPFFCHPEETNWESITVTCKGNKLLKLIEKFSGNIPGSGALMSFKDSSWRLSIVVAAQPYFTNQPLDTTIFWAYGLFTDELGDYVKKPMRECTGKEILTELIYHLHLEDKKEEIFEDVINVIPCMMPFANAQFQPRKMSDRPKVVPECSTNFAMISQFVEIPDDTVFTEEYSVRAARIAVYTLFNVKNKEIIPVTPYNKDPKVLLKALKKSLS